MTIKSLSIKGFRGFSKSTSIFFAQPNGEPGSGLTVLTGPNNSGKSSILECIGFRSINRSPSFDVEMRNKKAGEILITFSHENSVEFITSLKADASESQFLNRNEQVKSLTLPSRRAFNPYFGKGEHTRDQHIENLSSQSRANSLSGFEYRLFKVLKNPVEFNNILSEILGFTPEWVIDKSGQGQYFLKFTKGAHSHNSSGLGEGIISIFSIVDSLYDSSEGDLVCIDEPELSLHPSLQKRLSKLLIKYSATRQIIISTHSPYFINLESIQNGGEMYRIVNEVEDTEVYRLSNSSKRWMTKIFNGNSNNPHVFGLDAKEIFFCEDGVLLTEGQDDVIYYPKVFQELGLIVSASFYGWGMGGADNSVNLSKIMDDLGFQKVAVLLDNNQQGKLNDLKGKFPKYMFDCIPSEDIRTKKARKATPQIDGLLDEAQKIRPSVKNEAHNIIKKVADYFQD